MGNWFNGKNLCKCLGGLGFDLHVTFCFDLPYLKMAMALTTKPKVCIYYKFCSGIKKRNYNILFNYLQTRFLQFDTQCVGYHFVG